MQLAILILTAFSLISIGCNPAADGPAPANPAPVVEEPKAEEPTTEAPGAEGGETEAELDPEEETDPLAGVGLTVSGRLALSTGTSGLGLTSTTTSYKIVATEIGGDGTNDKIAAVDASGNFQLDLIPGLRYTLALMKVKSDGTLTLVGVIPVNGKGAFPSYKAGTLGINVTANPDNGQVNGQLDTTNSTAAADEEAPVEEFDVAGKYAVTVLDDLKRGVSAAQVENQLPEEIYIDVEQQTALNLQGDSAELDQAWVWSTKSRRDQCVDSSGNIQFKANMGSSTSVLDFSSQAAQETSLDSLYSALPTVVQDRINYIASGQADGWNIASSCQWDPTVESCVFTTQAEQDCYSYDQDGDPSSTEDIVEYCYTSWPSSLSSLTALTADQIASIQLMEETCRTWLNVLEWNEEVAALDRELSNRYTWCPWQTPESKLNHDTGLGTYTVAKYLAEDNSHKKVYLACENNIIDDYGFDKGATETSEGGEESTQGSESSGFPQMIFYDVAGAATVAETVAEVANPMCKTVTSGVFAGELVMFRSEVRRLLQTALQGGEKWGFNGQADMTFGSRNPCQRFEPVEDLRVCITPPEPDWANIDWGNITAEQQAAMDAYYQAWSNMPQACNNQWTLTSFGLKITAEAGKYVVNTNTEETRYLWPWLADGQADIMCPTYAQANAGFEYNLTEYNYETYESSLTAGAIACRDEFVAMSHNEQAQALADLGASSWSTPFEKLACFSTDATVKSVVSALSKQSCMPDTYTSWEETSPGFWGEVIACSGAVGGECYDADGVFQGTIPGLIVAGHIRYLGKTLFEIFQNTTTNFVQRSSGNGSEEGNEGGSTPSASRGLMLQQGTESAGTGGSSSNSGSNGGTTTENCTMTVSKLVTGKYNLENDSIRGSFTNIEKQKCAATTQNGQDSGSTATANALRLQNGAGGQTGGGADGAGGGGQNQNAEPDKNDWEIKITTQFRLDK